MTSRHDIVVVFVVAAVAVLAFVAVVKFPHEERRSSSSSSSSSWTCISPTTRHDSDWGRSRQRNDKTTKRQDDNNDRAASNSAKDGIDLDNHGEVMTAIAMANDEADDIDVDTTTLSDDKDDKDDNQRRLSNSHPSLYMYFGKKALAEEALAILMILPMWSSWPQQPILTKLNTPALDCMSSTM